MRRVFVDPERRSDAIRKRRGCSRRLVSIPTDTLYGLAADPFSTRRRRARVRRSKGALPVGRLPLIAADAAQVAAHLGGLSHGGRRLADTFWPGPLTLLIAAPAALAADVTAGTGSRRRSRSGRTWSRARSVPAVGHPITATSANLSGEPATADPDVVERTLGDRIDLLIDARRRRAAGAPSTYRVTSTGAEPARAGRRDCVGRDSGMAAHALGNPPAR